MVKDFFRDAEGNIIIGQRPNVPIIVWAVTTMSTYFVDEPRVSNLLSHLAFGAIFTWAWLELFHGDCPFRRVLGGSALAAVLLLAAI